MALNVITAKFCSGSNQTWTDEAWQYDYGQVLQFDGLELPEAYEVHFSNVPLTGTTITQIGGADGVTVPDQYFTTGETIYAWVYLHEGEDDGETVYMVTIPVKKRPQSSDDVPTPEEQSAITQAIAALNIAVEKAEDAIERYPTIIDGTWHVWDVTEEEYVDTGVQAQGQPGVDGQDGADGQDGFSPEVTVTDITGGHRVTITDAGGTHTFDVMDGEPGEPGATGNGIASITKTGTSGLVDTYTITYTNGQTTTFTVTNGSDATVTVDDELSTTSKNPVQNKVITEELNSTKADLSQKPDIKDSDATGVDLDVSDEDGNVLVRFKDGEIQTKEFNSADATQADTQMTDNDADLYITDENGNGVLRIANGNVRTKNFNSDNGMYKKTFSYSGSGSQSIIEFFPKETSLAFHLYDPSNKKTGAVASYKVTYTYTDRSGTSHTLGQDYGYNFPVYTLPEDATAVGITYGNGIVSDTRNLIFAVYAEGSFQRKPTVIRVAADGSGDYTTLRAAVDSITDNNEFNPFEIWIYPGTYNVLEDYTNAEISASGFQGLFICDGVSLIGQGQRSEIVINGTLDTGTYDSTKRNDVSTLNIAGTCRLENLTVNGSYIRYAIHDDTGSPTHKVNTRTLKNLKVYGEHMTSGGSGQQSYGAGGSNLKQVYATDCDFSDCMGIHTDANASHSYHVYLENCTARRFNFGDYDSGVNTYYFIRNCKVQVIYIGNNTAHTQYLMLDGEGTNDAMMLCPSGYVYNTGDCRKFYNQSVAAVKAVKLTNNYGNIGVATSLSEIYGVSLGVKDSATFVQTKGWINSNVLNLSGLAVGDYLTIDSSGSVVSGGTVSNAIAQVKFIDENNIAFAKLMI